MGFAARGMGRSSYIFPVAAWIFCLSLGMGSAAATTPDVTPPADTATTASAKPDEPPDEVIVLGKRLSQMRKAVTDADDRFFARYNEINKDHDFDVHCIVEAPVGTLIKRRTCRPVFQEKGDEDYARSLLDGTGAIPPEIVRLLHQDEYHKHMLEVVRANPELMKMVSERDVLKKQYEAELKRRMKDKWILFE